MEKIERKTKGGQKRWEKIRGERIYNILFIYNAIVML